MGANFGFVNHISDVLAKVQSMGEVTGRELRSLQLAGVAVDESVKGMKAPEFFDYLQDMLKKNDGLMKNIKGTWTGALDSFKSSLTNAGQEMLGLKYNAETFSWEGKGLDTLTESLNKITKMINDTRDIWVPLGDFILSIITKIGNMAERIGNWYKSLDEGQKSFVGKLSVMLTLLGPALVLVSRLGLSFGKLRTSVLPLVSVMGLLAVVWKNDLSGIRTTVETFIDSWKKASDLVKMSSSDMKNAISGLDQTTLGGKLIYNLVKIWSLIDILKEGFYNLFHNGEFWISEDNYNKMQDLGLQELVENIYKMYWNLQDFWKGFKLGVQDFVDAVKNTFSTFKNWLKDTFKIDFDDVFESFNRFLGLKNELEPEKWEKWGRIIGVIATSLTALFVASKLGGAFSFITKIFGGIGGILGKITGGSSSGSSSGGLLANPSNMLKGMGSLSVIIGGFGLIVSAFGLLAQVPGFSDFMGAGINTLGKLIKGMSVLMSVDLLVLTAAVAIMGLLSPATFLSGMEGLAVIIGGFALIVMAFGELALIPGFNDFLDYGAPN